MESHYNQGSIWELGGKFKIPHLIVLLWLCAHNGVSMQHSHCTGIYIYGNTGCLLIIISYSIISPNLNG